MEKAREAGAQMVGSHDFLDPWGNHWQVVDYREVQFTKAPRILDGMGLAGLEKSDEALGGAAREGPRRLADCCFAEESLHLGEEVGLGPHAVVGAELERTRALRGLQRDDDAGLAREVASRRARARGRCPPAPPARRP